MVEIVVALDSCLFSEITPKRMPVRLDDIQFIKLFGKDMCVWFAISLPYAMFRYTQVIDLVSSEMLLDPEVVA